MSPRAVEYQTCFLWSPITGDEPLDRPTKRRRFSQRRSIKDGEGIPDTVPLLLGKESYESSRRRSALFAMTWQPLQDKLDNIIEQTTADITSKVVDFLRSVGPPSLDATIPAGLIPVGPSNTAYSDLVRSITPRFELERDEVVVDIVPSQVFNLKAALKLINSRVEDLKETSGLEDSLGDGQKTRRLNYDLEILYDLVKVHNINKIVLFFQDSEAFDGALLADLVEVISLWRDRIPFVCLFVIKTSVELFQEKLDRATIMRLHGALFQVAEIHAASVFQAALAADSSRLFWLGPGLSRQILEAQHDSIQSMASFTRSLKYAYMTHFFANPLSVLLGVPLPRDETHKEIYECIRHLHSFAAYAESLLKVDEVQSVRRLLNDDNFLHRVVERELKTGKKALESLTAAVEVLWSIQAELHAETTETWTTLYVKAMAGNMKDSAIVRETLLTVRKQSSDAMAGLLDHLAHSPVPNISILGEELRNLQNKDADSGPLRSEHGTSHDSLRTTVVAQKVQLSKHSSSLSKQDLSYSELVNRVDFTLRQYFEKAFIAPQELFLHEVLVLDLKLPHREVFAPRPRYAIERGLGSPRDYLGCECCKGAQHGLSSTHPATSLLYQLYLESGVIVNISDLWSAFYTIVGKGDDEDEDDEHESALALFSRALAELKYMGIIKNSRKKADHLAKVLWNGL